MCSSSWREIDGILSRSLQYTNIDESNVIHRATYSRWDYGKPEEHVTSREDGSAQRTATRRNLKPDSTVPEQRQGQDATHFKFSRSLGFHQSMLHTRNIGIHLESPLPVKRNAVYSHTLRPLNNDEANAIRCAPHDRPIVGIKEEYDTAAEEMNIHGMSTVDVTSIYSMPRTRSSSGFEGQRRRYEARALHKHEGKYYCDSKTYLCLLQKAAKKTHQT